MYSLLCVLCAYIYYLDWAERETAKTHTHTHRILSFVRHSYTASVCMCASLFSPSNSNSSKKSEFRAFPFFSCLVAGHNGDRESKNQFDCHYNQQRFVMLGASLLLLPPLYYLLEKRSFHIKSHHISSSYCTASNFTIAHPPLSHPFLLHNISIICFFHSALLLFANNHYYYYYESKQIAFNKCCAYIYHSLGSLDDQDKRRGCGARARMNENH